MLIAPTGYVMFTLLAFVWRRDPRVRIRRLQRLTAFAYGKLHDWIRFVRLVDFDHRNSIAGIPEGASVVIANHPTLVDITAITAMFGGGCTIVKPALFRQRLLRGLLSACGHIQGRAQSADHFATEALLNAATERLREGFRLIVFPEGTRSPAGKMHPFARAPFEIAVRAGAPLVALTIEAEPPYLSKEAPMHEPPLEPCRMRIALLRVYDPSEFGGASRPLRLRVQRDYAEWAARRANANRTPSGGSFARVEGRSDSAVSSPRQGTPNA